MNISSEFYFHGQNEFAKLYRDKERKELFAWLCVYVNPKDDSSNSYIEHWAFVNPKDVNLYGTKFYGEVNPGSKTPPANREQWLKLLSSSRQKFKAVMHRKSLLFDYKGDHANHVPVSDRIFDNFDVMGNRATSIKLNKKLDWLILQQKPWVVGVRKEFYQVSLLKTLNVDGRCFNGEFKFSAVVNLSAPKSFKKFTQNGGFRGTPIKLPASELNHVIFSQVITLELPPSALTIPPDSLMIIPGKQPEAII